MAEGKLTLRELLKRMSWKEKVEFCEKVGTTLPYLRRISYGRSSPSLRMLKRMMDAAPNLDTDELLHAAEQKKHGS